MLVLFLLLVIVAMVLGIVGVVAKGLLYLLFIGIVVFLGALLLGALRMRRRLGRPPARQIPGPPFMRDHSRFGRPAFPRASTAWPSAATHAATKPGSTCAVR